MRLSNGLAARVPRGLIGMMVLIVVCESYIARNDLMFSRVEAVDWKGASKVAGGELPQGGVLFFGDSQIKFGVSPLLLESKLGMPSHCLAVQAGQAPTSYLMLRKVLESGVVPSAVIVDFEPKLNGEGIGRNKVMWPEVASLVDELELAWYAGNLDMFTPLTWARFLPSYRQREEIRENIKLALRGETSDLRTWLKMAIRNQRMNQGALAISKKPGRPPLQISPDGNPTSSTWAPHPVNDLYARRFLRLAEDHQIPVYCLLMPVSPRVQERYERNGLDRLYSAWIRTLQEEYPKLHVLDWRRSRYREASFADGTHLNLEGAFAITAALADYLKPSIQGKGSDSRWVGMPSFRVDRVAIAVEETNRSKSIMRDSTKRR
jgi:Protein of unknown function (DUF1574)